MRGARSPFTTTDSDQPLPTAHETEGHAHDVSRTDTGHPCTPPLRAASEDADGFAADASSKFRRAMPAVGIGNINVTTGVAQRTFPMCHARKKSPRITPTDRKCDGSNWTTPERAAGCAPCELRSRIERCSDYRPLAVLTRIAPARATVGNRKLRRTNSMAAHSRTTTRQTR